MKKAIVIGASRGIGLQVTASLLDDGCEVFVVTSRGAEISQNLGSYDQTQGQQLHVIQCDLENPDGRKSAIRALRASGGEFSSLVFVSALPFGRRLGMVHADEIRRVFEINTIAFVDVLQGLVRSFQKPASVVVVSSTSAHIPLEGNSVYGSSKIALERISASFALELRDARIRVNCVAPTLVDTAMLELMDEPARQKTLEVMNSQRALDVDEVAKVVRFLLSDDSRAINGETIQLGKYLPHNS